MTSNVHSAKSEAILASLDVLPTPTIPKPGINICYSWISVEHY